MPGQMFRELATQRAYRLPDGATWQVCNDYWRITCRSCEDVQYCRMTVIKRRLTDGRVGEERHLNFKDDLDELQALQVTYEPYDDHPEHAVVEQSDGGRWFLDRNGERFAEQVGPSASL